MKKRHSQNFKIFIAIIGLLVLSAGLILGQYAIQRNQTQDSRSQAATPFDFSLHPATVNCGDPISVTLNWEATTNATYTVKYCEGSGCNPTTDLKTGLKINKYQDTTGFDGISIKKYKIIAKSGDIRTISNTISAGKSSCESPTFSTSKYTTCVYNSSVRANNLLQYHIRWSEVLGATKFKYQYCLGATCTPSGVMGDTKTMTSHYSLFDTYSNDGTVWSFIITAFDDSNNVIAKSDVIRITKDRSKCEDVDFTGIKQTTPQIKCDASTPNGTKVSFSWNAVTEAGKYKVYRCDGSRCNIDSINNPKKPYDNGTSTSFTDTSEFTDGYKKYRVVALKKNGLTAIAGSDYFRVKEPVCDDAIKIVQMTKKTATCVTENGITEPRVNLAWKALTTAKKYTIHSCEGANCDVNSDVFPSTVTTTNFTYSPNFVNVEQRRYIVKALNSSNQIIGKSNIFSIGNPNCDDEPPGSLSGDLNDDGVVDFRDHLTLTLSYSEFNIFDILRVFFNYTKSL